MTLLPQKAEGGGPSPFPLVKCKNVYLLPGEGLGAGLDGASGVVGRAHIAREPISKRPCGLVP